MQRLLISLALAAAASACTTTGETERAATPQPAAAASAPRAPAFLAKDLLGRDAAALDARLGAPALVRREGEGEFRRYALADCALIIILYPDEAGRRTSSHLDSTAMRAGDAKPDLDACLAKGLAQKG